MKICIAQIKSLKGNIQENIKNHIEIIERAIKLGVNLIIFPELSITSYEPCLAKELATNKEDAIFNPFQKFSNNNNITIGIGMPINVDDGVNISMLIFQPNKERVTYSKQILHSDELPYFTEGTNQVYLNINKKKIAVGICYETLQKEHFLKTQQNGADIYIASVAKSRKGVEKAFKHFSEISKEFNTPVLMSNSIGFCDDFLSTGSSAVWNKKGEIVVQLNDKEEGLIVYDTKTEIAKTNQLKIEKGQLSDLDELFEIYLEGKIELERKGIYQWTNNYPTKSIIKDDLKKEVLFILKKDNEIIGAINISEEQEIEYQTINWKFDASKILVIHRLVIMPKHQRKGYAKKLMDFGENYAKENDYTSIRLDAYSDNEGVVEFYKKRNYYVRGSVSFSGRKYPFYCMEKEVK